MLRYFIRNRHGVISVMLAIVLTAVLSMGSTLMEIARYRSLERLHKEIAENAAFSILAHYDRDLYEYFGLLGIQQDVGEEELRQYLEQNLMGIGSGMSLNGADLLSSGISEVELDKLYDLTQNDVFRSQIAEFSAYRAPISIINNNLDIEASLQELTDKLAEALPMLEGFQAISTAADACLDTIINLKEYVTSSTDCQDAINKYAGDRGDGGAVGSYNAAISELNRYKDEEDNSEEGYEAGLEEHLNAVSENAADLQEKIADLIKALEDLEEKQDLFVESYTAMMDANLKALFGNISGIQGSAAGNDWKALVDEMEEGYDKGERDLTDLYNKLQDKLTEFQFEDVKKKLQAQSDEVSGLPQNLLQIDPVREVNGAASPIWTVVDAAVSMGGKLIENIESLMNSVEAIERIVECANLIGETATGGIYDSSMNNSIPLPQPYESLRKNPTLNPYATEDAHRKDDWVAETERIAESVGYEQDLLTDGQTPEMYELYNAMTAMQDAEEDFRDKCRSLSNGNLIEKLKSIKGMISSIKTFLSSLIDLVNIFISSVTENLQQLVYQKIYASVYATEMFSNRVTDKENDTRLNGSSFFSAADLAVASQCFVQADAEYIFWGKSSEKSNQTGVFMSMLAMRALCNIPAILTDSAFIEVLSSLAGVPIVGWIVDVLLVLTRIYVEAWADMIFMIYGREEVDIVKMKGYFDWSGEGLDELKSKMQTLLEEQTGYSMEGFSIADRSDKSGSSGTSGSSDNSGDSGKSGDSGGNSGFMQGYVDGLLEWGYKDHLFVLMLIFKSSDDIYTRCANLIELELQQKKAKDGAPQEFKLNEMATYIRVETEAEYTPLLPVPVIPGLNSSGLKIDTMHYSGY